jgi:hypothetical protein
MFSGHEKLVAGSTIKLPSEVLFTISRGAPSDVYGTLVGKHWCKDCRLILRVQCKDYFGRTLRRASIFYS